jgi:hypothetical protein
MNKIPKPGVREREIIEYMVHHKEFSVNADKNQIIPIEQSPFAQSHLTGNGFKDRCFLSISKDQHSEFRPFVDVIKIHDREANVPEFFDRVSEYLDLESAHPIANKFIFNYLTLFDYNHTQLAKALMEKVVQRLQDNVERYGADQVAECRDDNFIEELEVENSYSLFSPTHFYNDHIDKGKHNIKHNLFTHIISDMDHDRVRKFIEHFDQGLKLTIPEVERYHIKNVILTSITEKPETHFESIFQTGKGIGLDDDDFFKYIPYSQISQIKELLKEKVGIYNDTCKTIACNASLNDVTLYDLLRFSRDSLDRQEIRRAVEFSMMQLGFEKTVSELSDYILENFANNAIYITSNVEKPINNLVTALLWLDKLNPTGAPFMSKIVERLKERLDSVREEMKEDYDPDDDNEPFYPIASTFRKLSELTAKSELRELEPESGWALQLDTAFTEINKIRVQFDTYQAEIPSVSDDLIEYQAAVIAEKMERLVKEKVFDPDDILDHTL